MRSLCSVVLILVVALSQLCWGWGREGHQIIALITEDHLDQTTKVMIQALLGSKHLYAVSTWADDIRRDRPETKPWHHVNIPLGATYTEARDCAPPGSCVVEKISECVSVLTDKKATRQERAEALKFVVHFVGDDHQPMHAVKEFEGGNQIHIEFATTMQPCPGIGCYMKFETSLHGLWDTLPLVELGLPQNASTTQTVEYAKRLEGLIKENNLNSLSDGTPEQWANESAKLAQAAWVDNGARLDARYYDKEIGVANIRMALAGLRLARLLNESLGKMTPKDFHQSSPIFPRRKASK